MTTFTNIPQQVEELLNAWGGTISRRNFLERSGRLVVSIGAMAAAGPFAAHASAQAAGPYPDPNYLQLDSWIVIHEDSTATFYVGKTDCGQGTGTAFRQMMSDELDVAYDKTTCIMGSTDITVDQGGSGGSDAIQTDGWPMRRVAAEARRVLLEMAAVKLAVPVDQLAVSNAVISARTDPSKKTTYGELIGGRKFNVTLTGANVDATTGVAKVKAVQDLTIVGQSPQRYDIPAKVDATLKWAVDMKVPGMVHARNVKPPSAGAKLLGIDESSVRRLPGFIRVVSKGNYVAVVCEREEQAINAAKALKATWQNPATPPFPSSEDLRSCAARRRRAGDRRRRDAAPRTAGSSGRLRRQGHVRARASRRSVEQAIDHLFHEVYGMRNGIARFLGMRVSRVVWMEGPQGYGRGSERASRPLSGEDGRPVRVRWMRHETRTQGSAFTFRCAAVSMPSASCPRYAASADYGHLRYEADTVLIAR